jgi:small subunit ribosomal protein S3
MGQKVNPISFRLGYIKSSISKWIERNNKKFSKNVVEDKKIRNYLIKTLYSCKISKILIARRADDKIKVSIQASNSRIIIGKSGSNINEIKNKLESIFNKKFDIEVIGVKNPQLDARVTAFDIGEKIKKKMSLNRVAAQTMSDAIKGGAQGIKIQVSGRINGEEMANSQTFIEGKVPLHTIRANIDFAKEPIKTVSGIVGIKVWIYLSDIYYAKGGSKKIMSK